jgi:hypothetical protein
MRPNTELRWRWPLMTDTKNTSTPAPGVAQRSSTALA